MKFGITWPWEQASISSETQSYFQQDFTWLKSNEVIPVGSWRLYVFYVSKVASEAAGYSPSSLATYIKERLSQAGVAAVEPTPYAPVTGSDGGLWVPIAVLAENRTGGLTPTKLLTKMEMGTQYSLLSVARQAVGAETEEYLDETAEEPKPVVLAGPESMLTANTWYAMRIDWPSVALSQAEASQRLEREGMVLYPDMWKTVGPVNRIAYISMGDEPRKVADIRDLLGASQVVVNLAAGVESTMTDWTAAGLKQNKELAEAAASLGSATGETTTSILSSIGAVGGLLQYAPYVIGAAALWWGYNWWKRQSAGG